MSLLYDWLQASAKDRSNGRAIVHRDTYLSFRGLAHRVERRAQELRSYGIGPGSWVGLMLGNVPEFAVITLALSKLDAVAVPIDPTTSLRDLDMILEAAPLRALITRPQGDTPSTAPITPSLRITPTARPAVSKFTPESRRRLQGTLLNCNVYKREAPSTIDGVTPAAVLLTVDTGGDVKGVVRGEAHLAAVAATLGRALDLEAGQQTLVAAPLVAAYGFDFGLVAGLAHGMTLVLEDEISPKHLVRTLREESFALVPGTPALYASLARMALVSMRPVEPRDGHYLCAGASLARATVDGFVERFGARPRACYHTTETGPVAIDHAGTHPDSVGTPLPGVDVRVSAIDGSRLRAGTKGQVWVRTPAIANASVPKLPVPIRAIGHAGVPIGRANAEGWFRTGDLGTFDSEGRLTLDGREDDLVKVDGKRLALGEIAGCLESFAKVRAAEVRLDYDEHGDAMVVARVVRTGDCRAEDLIDHCAKNLAPYKVPRAIEFCQSL